MYYFLKIFRQFRMALTGSEPYSRKLSEYFRLQILIFVCITDGSMLNHKLKKHTHAEFHAAL